MFNKRLSGVFWGFLLFCLLTGAQFVFDVFGGVYLDPDLFREVVELRSLVLMLALVFTLGVDQAYVRFGYFPNKFHIFFKYWLLVLLLLGVGASIIFGSLYLFFIFVASVCYSCCAIVAAIRRRWGENITSQLFLSGWKLLLLVFAVFHWSVGYIRGGDIVIAAFFIPAIFVFWFGWNNVLFVDERSEVREFTRFSLFFMLFMVMLGVAQYADQFFAARFFSNDDLILYMALIAFFVAPSMVFSTFIGFVLAPKVAQTRNDVVIEFYRWVVVRVFVVHFVLFCFLLLLYSFVHARLGYRDFEWYYFLFLYFLSALRMVYSVNSSFVGMKSSLNGLLIFFGFCLAGVFVQIFGYWLSSYFVDDIVILVLLFSGLGWFIRNLGAYAQIRNIRLVGE